MFSDFIEYDPLILAGKPVLKGTRIGVEQVLEHLASGWSQKDILDNYPRLSSQHINASLAYATYLVHQERFFPLKAV